VAADIAIAELLENEGFTGPAAIRARAVLEEAGLTHARKMRIAHSKLEQVRNLLRARLARLCGNPACADAAQGREIVQVPASDCEACEGSRNRSAGRMAARALREQGVSRLLVLGGSPATQETLRSVLGKGFDVRCIDGTNGTRTHARVAADLGWAQVMVVWGSTYLPHKVSKQFTEHVPPGLRVVQVGRRGVEAVCEALARSAHASSK
jgi:hypothetical protein